MTESQRKPVGPEEIWQILREISEERRETDQRMKETDQKMKETDQMIKETGRQLRELKNLFTGQWGKLMESLVEGELVKSRV